MGWTFSKPICVVGSGGLSEFNWLITTVEFRVSTKIWSELLRDAMVNPSLNSINSSGLNTIKGSVFMLLSLV